MPARWQTWPNIAACWSPAMPPITSGSPNIAVGTMPKACADGCTSGSIARGTSSSCSSSWSQSLMWMLKSRVREALDTSVTCVRLPVRCQVSQVSTVPKASSPRSARRARAAHVVQQPRDLGAAEVGIDHQAGALAHQALGAHLLQLGALRRGTPVLPDDGVVDRLAGLPVPDDGGLALVGDADAHHVLQRHLGLAQDFARGVALAFRRSPWRRARPSRAAERSGGTRAARCRPAGRSRRTGSRASWWFPGRERGRSAPADSTGLMLFPLESAPYAIAGHRRRARAAPHAPRALRGLQARRRTLGHRSAPDRRQEPRQPDEGRRAPRRAADPRDVAAPHHRPALHRAGRERELRRRALSRRLREHRAGLQAADRSQPDEKFSKRH